MTMQQKSAPWPYVRHRTSSYRTASILSDTLQPAPAFYRAPLPAADPWISAHDPAFLLRRLGLPQPLPLFGYQVSPGPDRLLD